MESKRSLYDCRFCTTIHKKTGEIRIKLKVFYEGKQVEEWLSNESFPTREAARAATLVIAKRLISGSPGSILQEVV